MLNVVNKILVKVGDKIIKGQPLIDVKTYNGYTTIPSSHSGVITNILVKVGDEVSDDSDILVISNNITSPAKNTEQSKGALVILTKQLKLVILTKQLKDNIWLSN